MIVIYHAHLITLFANEVYVIITLGPWVASFEIFFRNTSGYSCCVFTKMNLRVVVANTCVEHINQDNETNNT